MTIPPTHVLLEGSSMAEDAVQFVVSDIVGGSLAVDGKEGPQMAFTLQEISTGSVRFAHDGSGRSIEPSFSLTVNDRVSTLAVNQKFSLRITDREEEVTEPWVPETNAGRRLSQFLMMPPPELLTTTGAIDDCPEPPPCDCEVRRPCPEFKGCLGLPLCVASCVRFVLTRCLSRCAVWRRRR